MGVNEKMDFKVNINEYVKVKLTDFGIKVLKEQHDELNGIIKSYGGEGLGEFNVTTDKDGYTKFQMWSLMSHFGHVLNNGGKLPFETEIVITKGQVI